MIRIITPFYNVSQFINRCIESVQSQTIEEWTWHMLDDASTDLVEVFDSRIYLDRQQEQKFQTANYVSMLKNPEFSPEDIVISIDADDWLPDQYVFDRILNAYSDGNTWITYGSFHCSNDEFLFSGPLEDASQIRHLPWKTSHLRTWKLWLWRLIKEDDLLGPDGSFLRCAGDMAWMFPMIEMAGSHSKWLKDINYIYNRENPLSCNKIRKVEQIANAIWFRSKPSYKAL